MDQVDRNIHEEHRKRTMERFDMNGFDGFADHEKLQVLLFYVDKRKDTNAIAHALINRFGSLSSVFDADEHELEEVDGIGLESARLIKVVAALFRAYSLDKSKLNNKQNFKGPKEMADYIENLYVGETNEVVYLLSLTARNKLIASDLIMRGNFDTVSIKARDIVKTALRRKAPRVVLTHNHPSGMPIPSGSDISCTKTVKEALRVMQIELVDHIVIGNRNYSSFVEMGIL